MATTIIRTARRQHFLVLCQAAVEDSRLSWAARGLLVYLLSRPDDWRIRVDHLRQQATSGRDAIYKLLSELRQHGYILRERIRGEDGRLQGTSYYVHETPSSPLPENPYTVKPYTAKPDPVFQEVLPNTELPSTEVQLILSKEKSSSMRSMDCGRGLILPSSLRPEWISACCEILTEFSDELAQQLLDELAGVIQVTQLRSTPLSYLDALARKARNNRFKPNKGLSVAASRERQREVATALSHRLQEPLVAPQTWLQHPLHERLTQIGARFQARRQNRDPSHEDS